MFCSRVVQLRRSAFQQGVKTCLSKLPLTYSVRHQSSINFQNNQLLQKQNLKQSKLKGKKGKRKEGTVVAENITAEAKAMSNPATTESAKTGTSPTEVEDPVSSGRATRTQKKKLPRDYSWLPRVPNTDHILREEFNTSLFYAGYRPIVVNDKNAKEDKLMEFAMKLEKLGEPVPWVSSATGLQQFTEWDSVPTDVIRGLKPFHPPTVRESAHLRSKEAKEKLQKQILLDEQDKLINRKRGRKKPIIRLLDLKRKFDKED